jgi:ABC-2 type transport system permease protein
VTTLAGTGKLVRLVLRRERLRLSIWVVVLAGVPIITANAFIDLYPTEASRQMLAATVISSPALTSMLGPLYAPSIGGLVAWRAGVLGGVFVALMAVLTVIRHTREEEETGRRELLGATVVGRHAQLAAAVIVTIVAGILVAALLTAGLTSLGLPFAGSLAFGLGFAGVAATFAGVGAVAAQLTEAASSARGIAVSVVGLMYLLRVAGDAGGEATEWMSWISPIGWFSRLRPYADEQWWVLFLWVGLAAVLIGAAVAIAARRDVAAGAFPSRPGPAEATASLSSPLGLAWRLHRGSVIGWTLGLAVLGMVYGIAGDSIGDLIEGNPQLAEILEQIGGAQGLTDTYFATVVGIIAIVISAYAIRAVLRLDVEEEAHRAEYVLATTTPRHRFAWSHLVFGLVVPVVMLAVSGAMAGATYGAIVGDVGPQVPRVLGAAMAQLPAVWVLTGTTMALYGLAPRRVGFSWGVLVACVLLGQFGQILQLPQWSLNLSPFTHIPVVPSDDVEILPFAILLVAAGGLIAAGLFGFRRRDVG